MIIAIASGKGGTGKTSVAVNLALSLQESVQLLDCDVDEPNVHTLLPLLGEKTLPVYTMVPRFDEAKCIRSKQCAEFCPNHAIFVTEKGIKFFPELCFGCGGCILSCTNKAIVEDQRQVGTTHEGSTREGIAVVYGTLNIGEPLVVPVIKAVKTSITKHNGGLTIVDCPPGVSCPMVESVHGADFCLLVTEPTPFGLHDLQLAVDTVRQLEIPIGVIVNRAGIGDQQVYSYCESEQIPILLEIPHDRTIAELFSEGIPFVMRMPKWRSQFQTLYSDIQRRIAQ
jgi:MinD superfamily P-loop ATPase